MSQKTKLDNTSEDWWKRTTIYQVYPRSFMDTNGDGIGDIRGIIIKLDYLQSLGFETIWLSPPFSSPQQDFGYDISDYRGIAPEYGTLKDIDELINGVHKRGMKIIFDMVINHTSIRHPWFIESRSDRNNPKRDWYIWRDGKGNRPPNNWKSATGGSAWHRDETTGQFYYASFLSFQPDLNFHNPEVKKEMLSIIRFWLDRGVDGFRLDIFHAIYKDPLFRSNPFSIHLIPGDNRSDCFFQKMRYNLHQPETFQLAQELRVITDAYPSSPLLLGEVFGTHEIIKKYLGYASNGLHLVFLFELLGFRFSAHYFKKIIQKFERLYPHPLMPTCVFGNHDRKRLMAKTGNDIRKARVIALIQYTLRCVPVTYYGEEIGMTDPGFPIEGALDPVAKKYRYVPKCIINVFNLFINRDNCRAPMQWDATPNAGFSPQGVKTWLPVADDYKRINVQSQSQDEQSLLGLYWKLLHLRNSNPQLNSGSIHLSTCTKNILCYIRELNGERCAIYVNFSKKDLTRKDPEHVIRILVATDDGCKINNGSIHIPAYSGFVAE